MSLYLPYRNGATAAVAICDRCKMKRYYDDLTNDPNSPSLRVCKDVKHGCLDVLDPYRLAARQPEDITLQWPRPDTPLTDTGPTYDPQYVGNSTS